MLSRRIVDQGSVDDEEKSCLIPLDIPLETG